MTKIRPQYRVLYTDDNGKVTLWTPLKNVPVTAFTKRVVPEGKPHIVTHHKDLPDHRFIASWELDHTPGTLRKDRVKVNMTKAKEKAHSWRQKARDREMGPFDKIVAAQIPNEAQEAEAERVKIRQKYADMQTAIDAATTPEELKALLTWERDIKKLKADNEAKVKALKDKVKAKNNG